MLFYSGLTFVYLLVFAWFNFQNKKSERAFPLTVSLKVQVKEPLNNTFIFQIYKYSFSQYHINIFMLFAINKYFWVNLKKKEKEKHIVFVFTGWKIDVTENLWKCHCLLFVSEANGWNCLQLSCWGSVETSPQRKNNTESQQRHWAWMWNEWFRCRSWYLNKSRKVYRSTKTVPVESPGVFKTREVHVRVPVRSSEI